MIITMIAIAFVCQTILTAIALSGIKFYTLNAEVEEARKDAGRLKALTLAAFFISGVALAAVILL